MKLVWHIAQKDLRRFALPIGVWLALIVASTLAVAQFSPRIEGHVASDLNANVGLANIWLRLVIGMQSVLGFVLAGSLVLEDPLAETKSFWLTRPIAKGRMLVAKVLAGAVGFVVAPVVALTPIWIANGFSAREVWAAGWGFAGV